MFLRKSLDRNVLRPYLYDVCTVLFSINESERYPFALVANRDEFLARPAQAMHWWEQGVLAGKDLEAGGMWLGLKRTGEFSVVTNVRDLKANKEGALSRGELVLKTLDSPSEASEFLSVKGDQYSPYNLLYGNFKTLNFQSNYNARSHSVTGGAHGLSNADFNTPWPKVSQGKRDLQNVITASPDTHNLITGLLDITASTQIYSDDELPETGVGIEWERALSAINIREEKYGTRVSTVVVLDHAGQVSVIELNRVSGERKEFVFQVES